MLKPRWEKAAAQCPHSPVPTDAQETLSAYSCTAPGVVGNVLPRIIMAADDGYGLGVMFYDNKWWPWPEWWQPLSSEDWASSVQCWVLFDYFSRYLARFCYDQGTEQGSAGRALLTFPLSETHSYLESLPLLPQGQHTAERCAVGGMPWHLTRCSCPGEMQTLFKVVGCYSEDVFFPQTEKSPTTLNPLVMLKIHLLPNKPLESQAGTM